MNVMFQYLKPLPRFFVPFLVISFFSFSACRKDQAPEKGEVLSFIIEASKNDALLSQDITAVIEANTIVIPVPQGILLNNVHITCDFKGESLFVDNVMLDPAGNQVQISNNTVLTVRTKSGGLFDYKITLSGYEDPELAIGAYGIEKSKNPELRADVNFEIIGDTIYGSLDPDYPELVPTFSSASQNVKINGAARGIADAAVNFNEEVVYSLVSSKGFIKSYFVKINWNKKVTIPHIYIITEGSAAVNSKENYVQADISIDGKNIYSDYTGTTRIKGRGNSTWGYPKKPYRLKLDSKASLLGLSAEKDWVLLANYLDGTNMLNAVAMEAGRLLEIPYTNNIVPVELTLNGEYKGLYMFTEQVEAEKNRVNVGDGGVLIELDQNFDEPWQFKSASYNLPVMLKYPDLTSGDELVPIRSQFEQMEALIAAPDFPDNNYLDYIDGVSVANYLIVYMLTDNEEINHPKSTYMHKTSTGKYTMGPIWDFDWAFSYEGSNRHFSSYSRPLFWSTPSSGTLFFTRLLSDPQIKEMVRQQWTDFRGHKLTGLLNFVDEYSGSIEGARYYDYQLWKRGGADFANETINLKAWLQNRASYLDTYIESL
jgi:hypothetical protein